MWTLAFGHHEDRTGHAAGLKSPRIAPRPMAMSRRARPRWRHSPRVGGGSRTTTAATLAFIVALAQQEKHHDASVGNCWSIRRDFGAGAPKPLRSPNFSVR